MPRSLEKRIDDRFFSGLIAPPHYYLPHCSFYDAARQRSWSPKIAQRTYLDPVILGKIITHELSLTIAVQSKKKNASSEIGEIEKLALLMRKFLLFPAMEGIVRVDWSKRN